MASASANAQIIIHKYKEDNFINVDLLDAFSKSSNTGEESNSAAENKPSFPGLMLHVQLDLVDYLL